MPVASAPARRSRSRISGMFDAIAGRYDFLNHLLSAGLDKQWRKRAVAALQLTGRETVLDLCTGYCGSRARGHDRAAARSACHRRRLCRCDAARSAKENSRLRPRGIDLIRGDATCIPLNDATVRRCDHRLRHPQRRARRSGLPRDRQGASSRRHARDSGIFAAAFVAAAEFLSVVFPESSCRRSDGSFPGIRAPTRICQNQCSVSARLSSFRSSYAPPGLAPCVQSR